MTPQLRSSLRRLLPLLASLLLTLLPCCLLPSITSVDGAHLFDAYRLIQYDRGTSTYGSRRTALNHQAVTPSKADSNVAKEEIDVTDEDVRQFPQTLSNELSRKVAVVRISALTPEKLANLLARSALGLLIVLPRDLTVLSDEERQQYKAIEKFLATHHWDAAIYFAFEDEYLTTMVKNMEAAAEGELSGSSDRYHLQVATPDATLLTGVNAINYHGWSHAAASSSTDSDTLPTIAIVSNYDAFNAVPGLSSGLDQNGSGTIALLELTRLFQRLYSDARTHGGYNILFLLTSADRQNYQGTKSWLRNIDSRVLESMEFALCLERLASAASESLYLHVSKLPKTPEISAIYNDFSTTAKEMNIQYEMVHRKINISNPTVYWQHEQFSRKRIVAATLSSSREPQIGFDQGSIFDKSNAAIDVKLLERNIKFVIEALGKHIYGLSKKTTDKTVATSPAVEIIESGSINTAFLSAYFSYFNTTISSNTTTLNRFVSYLSDTKTNSFLQILESTMSKSVQDFKRQSFSLDQLSATSGSIMKVYKDKEGGANGGARIGIVEMQAYQVKPVMFDVYLALMIGVYLLVVYVVCKQPKSVGDVTMILIGR